MKIKEARTNEARAQSVNFTISNASFEALNRTVRLKYTDEKFKESYSTNILFCLISISQTCIFNLERFVMVSKLKNIIQFRIFNALSKTFCFAARFRTRMTLITSILIFQNYNEKIVGVNFVS